MRFLSGLLSEIGTINEEVRSKFRWESSEAI
jgi:hypothetical protein